MQSSGFAIEQAELISDAIQSVGTPLNGVENKAAY